MHRSSNPTISQQYQRVLNELTERPRTWLVTGAAGFIGSNLVEQLLELRQRVIGLDNFSTGSQANIDEVLAAHAEDAQLFTMIRGDIRDPDTCRDACKGVDVVLHQAALGSVPRSIKDPATTNDVNVSGFLNMLVAAHEARVSRFVYASSSSVYGSDDSDVKTEEQLGEPLSPYAATKKIDEIYARVFSRVYGIECIGLRYFNVFGPRQDPNGPYAAVIPRWTQRLLDGEPCLLFGEGTKSRDFCYVANVVQANLLAVMAGKPAVEQHAFNVACGQRTTLNELFEHIRARVAQYHPEAAQLSLVARPPQVGDIPHSLADISKAQKLLGYEPTYDIVRGLDETTDWYVSRAKRPAAAPVKATAPVQAVSGES
jgi:UDP-N-acetylglucosamine 4-epimerase